jgi:hypothetical protein
MYNHGRERFKWKALKGFNEKIQDQAVGGERRLKKKEEPKMSFGGKT